MNNPKVLIIEDDRSLSKMYKTKFEIEKFIVITANTGKEGIQKALNDKPNLILLDMHLPEADGIEVIDSLVEDQNTRVIPIIALTNVAEQEQQDMALQKGAKEYLIKAMHTPEEVVQIAKKHLTTILN